MQLSSRLQNFAASATVAINSKVTELKAQGQELIALNVGEPDFDTPAYIKEAAVRALEEGFTKYTPVAGIAPLREAIARKLLRENGVSYTPREISVSAGAKKCIFNACMALISPGDEVIVPTPCWVSYTELVKLAGGVPVLVESRAEDGFALNMEGIRRALSGRTRAIIICSPNNPTGTVYDEEQLRELAEIAVAHDLVVLADEIYEKLLYDGAKHFSLASVSPEVREHVLIINGFSKAYAMTGWRLGYAAGPQELIAAMNKLQTQTLSCVNSIAQRAGIAALEGPQENLKEMVEAFAARRAYLVEELQQLPQVTCAIPRGAFYLLPDISAYLGKSYRGQLIKDDIDFCSVLLEAKHVAVVPGSAFYAPGKVRLSYANSLENLRKAMEELRSFLSELK